MSTSSSSSVARTTRQRHLQQQQQHASAQVGGTNIWQVMNYPIPRGKCVHKPSVLSSSCPCLRFMLNPLQAASSFVCDGCGHHASFHNLRNAGEEEGEEATEHRGKKRAASAGGNDGANEGGRLLTNGARRLLSGGGLFDDNDLEVVDIDREEKDEARVVKRTRA